MFPDKKNQRGFSLMMGIFIVVVLGGIAVFIARVVTMQNQSSALDEEGVIAYEGAHAGIEWATFQLLQQTSGAFTAACDAGSTSSPMSFPTGSDLQQLNYTVTVGCTGTTAVEGTTTLHVYRVTSTAHNSNNAAGNYYVERQLQATVTR